jgi:hypothetical protein
MGKATTFAQHKTPITMKMKSLLFITITALACTVSSMAQNVPSYIPTDGLLGWWPFNGNANDESGNGNNGTVNGATLTSDRFGNISKSYNFNGNSDYISVPNIAIQGNNERTFSSWFLTYNNPIWFTGEMIISTGSGSNLQSETFNLRLDNQNQYLGFMGFVNDYYPTGNVIVNDSVWHLGVLTYKDDTLKFYVDGQFEKSTYQPGLSTSGQSNFFGKSNDINQSAQGYWIGKLDDIGIWNRALTQQEISALYSATNTTNNNQTSNTAANVPGAISYQAVARDAQGAPLADTNVQVQFTLLADSLTGAAEYTETHTLTTNSLGLFTTAFGAGTPVSGTFGGINWSAGNKYLNVQIDTGSGLVDMGTQQLLSTPYSLYSAKAGSIKNPGLPVYADNAAAIAGGLVAGDMYRTSAGDLKIVY